MFRLEVADTGIGIRPEDIGRLFVEFEQLDSGAARQHQGTGLGLALTKRIVETQGGSVGVHSQPGQGSIFFAVLPRRHGTPAEPRTTPQTMLWRGAPSILVVEDDPRDREWLVRTLAEAEYVVESAATGAEALAKGRARRYDALLLDLLLPDMVGWDVLREIRSKGPNRLPTHRQR